MFHTPLVGGSEQYKMEEDIDIEEHELPEYVDRAGLKQEIIDFDITEDSETPTTAGVPEINEKPPDGTAEVIGGDPAPACSTHDLDLKPDILYTNIPETNHNFSESYDIFYNISIKRESENEIIFDSNEIGLDENRGEDTTYNTAFDNNHIKYEPDTEITINHEGNSRRITVMEKYPKLKVVLTDCYTSLLDSKCYCAQCAVLFATAEARSEHYTSTHVESALVTCNKLTDTGDICMKSFGTREHLKEHKLIHTGEKPFHCNICMKSYSTQSSLVKHKFIHTGEKPFECEICEKSFRNREHLKKHKFIHTGEKPFHCNICMKSFTQRGNLATHKLIHTGEKPFHCNICMKSFRTRGNLKKHKLIHTGQKPFECEICEKSFRRRENLKKHKLIHTGEKPFECEICEKSFGNREHLKEHKLIHTGEKPFHRNCPRY